MLAAVLLARNPFAPPNTEDNQTAVQLVRGMRDKGHSFLTRPIRRAEGGGSKRFMGKALIWSRTCTWIPDVHGIQSRRVRGK